MGFDVGNRKAGSVGDPGLHENDQRFIDYYIEASASEDAVERARGIMRAVLRARRGDGLAVDLLEVADIGCNAGAQSQCWLEQGHTVRGLDISRELVAAAAHRCERFGERARFDIGTATMLPWSSESFDVCLLPQLLEHVQDWRACLSEAVRVLKRGGTLYVSTTNVLCPVQQEFNLPIYSWYPRWLKRHYVRRATTTSPEIANFATFPAYHWFSPYSLRRFLEPLGLSVLDRFDLIDVTNKGRAAQYTVQLAQMVPVFRFLGHVLTESTIVVAHKHA